MIKIDGKKIAKQIIETLKPKLSLLPDKKLAAVMVGDDVASLSFLKQKQKVAAELSVEFKIYHFAKTISQRQLKKDIQLICSSPEIGGVIIQLPLPLKFDRNEVLQSLDADKDIDNLTGKSRLKSPTVLVVEDIFRWLVSNYPHQERIVNLAELILPFHKPSAYLDQPLFKIAVVGKGFLVGQPIINWLSQKNGILLDVVENLDLSSHSGIKELKEADLIISGVGKAGLINPAWLKKEASVIDFGFSVVNEGDRQKIAGDLDLSRDAENTCSHLLFYTPTPGGTGPILTAELFKNFIQLISS